MTTSVKTFPIVDVISAYSGIMLCENFDSVWKVADHVTGQSLMTHQLATEHPMYAEALVEQHPFLSDLDVPTRAKGNFSRATVDAFLVEVTEQYGETLEIATVTDYRRLHPLDGLSPEMLEKTTVVVMPENES